MSENIGREFWMDVEWGYGMVIPWVLEGKQSGIENVQPQKSLAQ